MTPPTLARAIVEHYRPTGRVLDPARGHGAFYNAMRAIHEVPDLVDWCEIAEGRDFLTMSHPHYEWACTNPPWSLMRRFLTTAMAISDNVVFLATLTHFVTSRRRSELEAAGFGLREALLLEHPRQPGWPRSGFQLAAAHLQRGYAGGLTFSRLGTPLQPSRAAGGGYAE